MKKPIVWTIAGVDSSGLAGIHADMETFSHLNVRACSVITA
ncbi:TPA: bifunctional hydroxymethylpyrimidine kinase/phosphomethylpyrimidine kinase, partial [Legionella pneumophila]